MPKEKKYSCSNCGKALFFGLITEGRISKDCSRCGQRNIITVSQAEGKTIEKIELIKKSN